MPSTVTLLGHVDGEQKLQLLSSAWVLVNTSIHEALPTSVLEALACETPVLSCTNQEGVVSRFGVFTGWCGGDGISHLPTFAAGLRRLITNDLLRTQFGKEGRRWVERTHNTTTFLNSFDALCLRAGIDRGQVAKVSVPTIRTNQGAPNDCAQI